MIAVGDVHHRAVAAVRDVERRERVVGLAGDEVLGDPLGPLGQHVGQTGESHPVGRVEVRALGVDDAVDHDDARAVEGGDLLVEVGGHGGGRLGAGPNDSSARAPCGAYRHASSRLVG